MSLFTDEFADERDSRLNKVIDDINTRFGAGVIKSAAEAEYEPGRKNDAKIMSDPFHPEDDPR